MKKLQENWFMIMTAVFLIGALGTWPYAYYQILRWVVCAIGIYSAYQAYESHRTGWVGVFAVIAVLFNPIVPFYMQKETWQILDLVAAIPFLVFPFSKQKHD